MNNDLISRQQAIDALLAWMNDPEDDRESAFDVLKQLPSAQPKRGKWIIYTVSPFDGEDVMCSECGQRGCAPYWDYCPNCGAKMEGVHEAD